MSARNIVTGAALSLLFGVLAIAAQITGGPSGSLIWD